MWSHVGKMNKMSWRKQKCPKDGELVEAFLVAGGYGEPRLYPKKCFKEGKGKCTKDKRKRICEFELPEEMK